LTPKVILKMICKLNNEYKEELEKWDPKKFAARLRSLQKANGFLEPKTGWKNSRAREILWDLLHTGDIPLDGKKLTTKVILKKVCDMSDEHKEEMEKWDSEKFAGRLRALRKQEKEKISRVAVDEAHFKQFVTNQPVTSFQSYYGYIHWQGSDAQKLLRQDIEAGKEKPPVRKRDLWLLRKQYWEEFPLNVFRDCYYQEIRTAKYLHTVKVKGKKHNRKVKGNNDRSRT